MKRFTLLFVVLIMISLTAAVAYAAPHEIEESEFAFLYPLVDCGAEGVGDFWIWNDEKGTDRIKVFYDNDGSVFKEKGHASGIDTLFVPGYPEKVVTGHFVGNWIGKVDKETGEFVRSIEPGNWWHIQVPGTGNAIHIVGLNVYELDPDTGWQQVKETGLFEIDLVPLCEYLAP